MKGAGYVYLRRLAVTTSMSPALLVLAVLLISSPLGGCSPIMAPEAHRPAPGLEDGRGGLLDPSLLEQDSEVDMQKLLETLKGQFLRTFNLSGLGPHPRSQSGSERIEPPEYMMELYNRFANDRTAMPTANIIRSFKNEDSSPCQVGPHGVRIHSLLFNVSLPHHERVTAAELRLYTLVQNDRHLYAGVDRKVIIYEAEQHDLGAGEGGGRPVSRGEDLQDRPEPKMALVELASRQLYGTDNGWESFDMTAAVHRWRKADRGTTHRLEVHIASLGGDLAGNNQNGGDEAGDVAGATHPGTREEERQGATAVDDRGDMEIETGQEDRHRPLMIVFSDDQSSGEHRGERRDLNEMMGHEVGNAGIQDDLGRGLNGLLEELGEMGLGGAADNQDTNELDEEALMQMRSNLIYDTSSRIRRNAKGNHCKKSSLFVEFKDIGWDSWILAPTGYEAFECTGVCPFPLTSHFNPTKHAMVQTLVNMKSPQRVAPACCVPTKLDPISLLYLDDAGVVTYKYKFEGMVVAECGCR